MYNREKEENRRDTFGGADRGGDTTILKAAPHLPVSNSLLLSCGALALCLASSPQGQIHTSQQSPCSDHGLIDIALVLSSSGQFSVTMANGVLKDTFLLCPGFLS